MATSYRIKKTLKHKHGASRKIISGTTYRINSNAISKRTYRETKDVGSSTGNK